MNETVLLTGGDGFLGHALTLRLLKEGYSVICVDDFRRRRAVKEMGSFSATPIKKMKEKEKVFNTIGEFDFLNHSMERNYRTLYDIINKYKPSIIINLAQQPAAPYSQISRKHATTTSIGNIIGTINMLYAIKETKSQASLIQIGTMGEYQPDVNVDIPEGLFKFKINGRESRESIFPRRPGSFYHASKVACTYYIDFACRSWGINALDIQQAPVFGLWTPEIEETGLFTRFDSDESFGTVVNRFIVQAIIGHPLTLYGKGLHSRGFLSINDSIQALMLAVKNPPKNGYSTWNQLTEPLSMVDVANQVIEAATEKGINIDTINIPSPRTEVTEKHHYNPITKKLKKLGYKPTRTIKDESLYAFDVLDKKELIGLENVMMPKIMWR